MGLVRLFLAYVVAAEHWRVIVSPAPMQDWHLLGLNAGYAVMFFYMISGFLITYALSTKYADNTGGFYESRFIRIFSLYWPLAAISFIFMEDAFRNFIQSGLRDQLTALFIFGQDWSVSFGKDGGQYFAGTIGRMPQSWTLGAELTFYAMAPLLVKRTWLAAGLLIASLAARLAFLVYNGAQLQVWTYTFFPTTLCFFLLGYFAAKAHLSASFINKGYIAPAALLAMVAVLMFWRQPAFDSAPFWTSIALFAIALPSLFAATMNSKWMNALGNLSYPLYLIHIMLIIQFKSWILSFDMNRYAAVALFAVFAVLASAAAHYLIERNVARLMWVSLKALTFNRSGRRATHTA